MTNNTCTISMIYFYEINIDETERVKREAFCETINTDNVLLFSYFLLNKKFIIVME